MSEFTIGDHEYRSGKIDVFKQNNIVRRLSPFMAAFASVFDAIKADPMAALEPLAKAFSSMSDEDMEYIMTNALMVVSRKQTETTWAKVWVPGGGLNFQDLELIEVHEIVFHVLKDNLSSFFSKLVPMVFVPPPPNPE